MDQALNSFGVFDRKTGKDVRLTLQHLELGGVVHPAGAHLRVSHVFESGESKPVEAVYCFALPRDAALRSFTVRCGDSFTESKLLPRREAEEQYEEGVAEGNLAVLAQGYRDGVVNLSVGNLVKDEAVRVDLEIISSVELRDDGYRFRFPFTLSPTYHPKARAESDGFSGSMQLPSGEFGDVLLPVWLKDSSNLHTIGCSLKLVSSQGFAAMSSPSHRVSITEEDDETRIISLASGSEQPNRDLVVEVKTKSKSASVYQYQSGGMTDFFAVVPSTEFGGSEPIRRRVVFVLDRSGSMQGEPIAQAKAAVKACLGAFGGDEKFNIIAFDDRTKAFKHGLVDASARSREDAQAFIDRIDARGGTELLAALEAGMAQLKDSGDIFLLTDGQVSSTENIIERLASANVRVHTLGIGSASQDRFIALLSRTSGGMSRFLTPRERVDLGALELFSSIRKPAATQVEVNIVSAGGEVEPEPAKTVYKGTPLTAYGSYTGAARLGVSWGEGGRMEVPLETSEPRQQEVIRLARGARLITDEESKSSTAPGAGKEATRLDLRLRRLSEEYGLASRACSLVAVVKRPGDKPGAVPKTRIVPVGMPEDVNFGGYFRGAPRSQRYSMMQPSLGTFNRRIDDALHIHQPRILTEVDIPTAPPSEIDDVIKVASFIQPDGGLPASDDESRAAKSLAAYIILKAHNRERSVFEPHLEKLRRYLEGILDSIPKETSLKIRAVLKTVESGAEINPKTATLLLKKMKKSGKKLMKLIASEFP